MNRGRIQTVFYWGQLALSMYLLGCESRQPAKHAAELAVPARATAREPFDSLGTNVRVPAETERLAPADTADLTRRYYHRPGPKDSLIQIGSRRYRLSVRVDTDSTKPIEFAPAESVGNAFAAPSDTAWKAKRVRGYQETYSFTLRDSVSRAVVFRRQLRKPDFYAVAPRDMVTVMNLSPPAYLGYSAALDALVFVCYPGIPYSDVGQRATLLLDRQGRVKGLSPGGAAWSEAPDCDPRLSPSGRAVLTCSEILSAGRKPVPLFKPHKELRAARFLNDSTLLVVYENGDYVKRLRTLTAPATAEGMLPVEGGRETAPMDEVEFVTTAAQRRLPTAYLISTNGRVLCSFKLRTSGAFAYDLLRSWLKPASTYVFFNEYDKLVLVPKAHPDSMKELPLHQLARFRKPQLPQEKRYEVRSDFSELTLYVDTTAPHKIRYQLKKAPSDY
jgi:hypothetical protein